MPHSTTHRLERNLRPLVREAISSSEIPNLGVSTFQDLINPGHSLVFRVFWFLIIVTCFAISCYQITDRVFYLLTYPPAVDIAVNDIFLFILPGIKMCTGENEYVREKMTTSPSLLECALPILSVLNKDNISYKEVWKHEGPSTTYESHEFLNNIVIKDIPFKFEPTFLGQCSVFGEHFAISGHDLRGIIKINMFGGKMCDPGILMVSIKDKLDFKILFPVISGLQYDARIGARKYHYLNTARKPCATKAEEFDKCYRNCVIRRLNTEAYCRLPYFDSSIDLPPCNNKSSALDAYFATINLFTKAGLLDKCHCISTCNDMEMVLMVSIFPNVDPQKSSLILHAIPQEIVLTEKLAYDYKDLLTDIGGNLGLFLGLSIVAILNIIYVTMQMLKTKLKPQQPTSIPVQILKEQISTNLYQEMSKLKQEQLTRENLFVKILRWILTILCVCLAVFMIVESFALYCTHPVRRVVSVDVAEKVILPSYTVCGSSSKMGLALKLYAAANNRTNECEIDTLDLLQGNKSKSVKTIWKNSEPEPYPSKTVNQVIKNYVGATFLDPNYTTIPTHLGACSHYSFNEVTYSGFFTVFILIYGKIYLDDCPNNFYNVFYDDPGSETYNILTRVESPTTSYSYYDYRPTTMKYLHDTQRPCVDEDIFKQCKQRCLLKHLNKEKFCGLPFLPHSFNLSNCNSTAMAKHTRQRYTEILFGVTLGSICHCTKPCKQNVVTLTALTEIVDGTTATMVAFVMLTNVIETIEEMENYSIIAMFSDIGNSLGLALGISVLTAAQIIRKIFASFRDKIFKPTHSTG